MLVLSISGVYAEDIGVDSSVVAESPISADGDTGLSSCNAFNNGLSSIYEPSDSSDNGESSDSPNVYESSDSYIQYESSDVPQINEIFGYTYNNSNNYEFDNIVVIGVDYNYVDSYESMDVPVVYAGYANINIVNYFEFSVGLTDIDVNYVDVDHGTFNMAMIDEEIGVVNPTIEIVDDKVIINIYNSFSKDVLENIYIPVSLPVYLDRHDGVGETISDTIISEVTFDMETSESYKLIRDVTQADNLLNFENVDAVLAINVAGIPNGEASEPVFDGILRVSEYISSGREVYFGIKSDMDFEKLLRSVDSENTLLFASIANWYPGVTFDMLQKLADNHGQICEDILDGYTVTKALLQYYPLTNELYIYKLCSDSEDEHSHVINDTNSHGLDYAYAKHVNVIDKDMLNLILLTSFGSVFVEEHTVPEVRDSLNDVLGIGISSETLLPDHKAIWTPLLLLTKDSQESIVKSHADDGRKLNKSNVTCTHCTKCNNRNGSNSSNKTPCNGGKCHHCHRKWGHGWCYSCCCHYAARNVVPYISLSQLDNNPNMNSTNNNTNSSNVTTTSGKRKSFGSPKNNVENAEPTYTLVYAIIGIIFVCYLFNSSYMRRDD